MVLMGLLIPGAEEFYGCGDSGHGGETLSIASFSGIFTAYLELLKLIFAWDNFQNLTFICSCSWLFVFPPYFSESGGYQGAFKGLSFIFLILLILNVIGLSQAILVVDVLKYNILMTSFLMIAVIFSLITLSSV